MSNEPSLALVLETNNLTGGDAEPERVARSLERLLSHLSQQSFGLPRLTELVVTHDGPLAAFAERLEAAAGRPLTLLALGADADYYEAKNRGFDVTTADVVVFGDGDCWPDATWLEHLHATFVAEPTTRVAAGRTTYRDGLLGTAASSIDFMYFTRDRGRCTRNFYANNVAFRRDVFEAHPFPLGADLYKGNCQLLGVKLAGLKIPIRFVPRARTIHRFPDSWRELVHLRFLRGRDLRRVAPGLVEQHGGVYLGPAAAPAVWLSRAGFSLASLGRQDMARLQPIAAAVAPAAMLSIAALDGLGALGAGDRIWRKKKVLSYHDDRDRLAA